MEMSLVSWLGLLSFYMLYILLGGCMFNAIECQVGLAHMTGRGFPKVRQKNTIS